MANTFQIILIVLISLILILVISVCIASRLFSRQADQEAKEIVRSAELGQKDIIQSTDLEALPLCVKKWMQRSGVVGQPKVHSVRLTQTGRLRLDPQKPWMPVEAVQYINIDEPAFVWKATVKMAPLIFLKGKDRYFNGHGSMQIKLLSLFSVVHTQPSKEMDQSTMVRYLAEMIWYPTAALNDYIRWEEVDANSAKATMNWQGVEATMLFKFNEAGDLISSQAPRYQEVNGKFVLHDWGGISRDFSEFNGIRIVSKSDVVWKYETGDFNWFQIEISDIEFNPTGLY